MSIIDAIAKRRSIYQLNKNIPLNDSEVESLIKKITELVPDAFNMKSARIVLALGAKHDQLWDTIYSAFGGKVSREKIDSFKSAYGTVLYYYDSGTIKAMQEKFAPYAANFPVWANQANGMLQFTVWSALRELNIGANLQHYNPVIDEAVKKLFDVPEGWVLVAQMPFGGIAAEPEPKDPEDISLRVKVER
ncbi:MAG: nitroreductase family protein [Synergistaceae bacterium]|nr:nitroreductase family protein [Synergistaceae bacterium]